jgi:hypothetical protein
VRKEQILARAAAVSSLQEGIRCERVQELMGDAAAYGINLEAEIFEHAYGERSGQKYWETHLSEILPIETLADLLSVHLAQSGLDMEETKSEIVSTLYSARDRLELFPGLEIRYGEVYPWEAVRLLLNKPKRAHLVPRSLCRHLQSRQRAAVDEATEPQRRVHTPRKRGPKSGKLKHVKESMIRDLREGRQTAASLQDMPEKALAATYGCSRDTVRKARNDVLSLSEFAENPNLAK